MQKLRNMQFCTYTTNKNTCWLGQHFVESTGEAEITIYNSTCALLAWYPPGGGTRAGITYEMIGGLPNPIDLVISEWWPTFSYEDAHYINPTCVEDSQGGAPGCWQSFACQWQHGAFSTW